MSPLKARGEEYTQIHEIGAGDTSKYISDMGSPFDLSLKGHDTDKSNEQTVFLKQFRGSCSHAAVPQGVCAWHARDNIPSAQ